MCTTRRASPASGTTVCVDSDNDAAFDPRVVEFHAVWHRDAEPAMEAAVARWFAETSWVEPS